MRRLLPSAAAAPDDALLLASYAPPAGDAPFIRFNFVSSLDGAATLGGLSGALGTAADKRVFMLLRRQADVILVGAGTIRAEGYEGELLDEPSRTWRVARSLPERPVLVVVSGHLDLDPHSELFTQNPGQIMVLTTGSAAGAKIEQFESIAEVVSTGTPGPGIDPRWIIKTLAARGHRVLHSEGGPTLFADFQRADAVDSLCVTYTPLLAGGDSPRIAHGTGHNDSRPMSLHTLFEEDAALLAEYRRAPQNAPADPEGQAD